MAGTPRSSEDVGFPRRAILFNLLGFYLNKATISKYKERLECLKMTAVTALNVAVKVVGRNA